MNLVSSQLSSVCWDEYFYFSFRISMENSRDIKVRLGGGLDGRARRTSSHLSRRSRGHLTRRSRKRSGTRRKRRRSFTRRRHGSITRGLGVLANITSRHNHEWFGAGISGRREVKSHALIGTFRACTFTRLELTVISQGGTDLFERTQIRRWPSRPRQGTEHGS